tara:strand:+ start:11159 stop:15043 length:3885 start_codon:yes stop_codon:yes gene_type:complete
MLRTLVSALTLLSVVACASPPDAGRPHDPIVFRSVLDERPRMVTIALDDEMWVAYDATHCGIYKVWKGGVVLQGAVYDTVHGPQPVTWGKAYHERLADRHVWRIVENGERREVKPRFLGYERRDPKVTLRYELPWGDTHAIVTEHPEFAWDANGWPTLNRTFTVSPADPRRRLSTRYHLELLVDDLYPGPELKLTLKEGTTPHHSSFDPQRVANVEPPADLNASMVDSSATSNELRSHESILEVPMTLNPPTIDGELEAAWNDARPEQLTKHLRTEPTSEDDLAGQFQLLYDAQYLYVMFTVRDDVHQNDNLTQPYHDDAVEVYLDAGNDKGDHFDANDVQYIFGVDAEQVWAHNGAGMHPGVDFATGHFEDGYRVEIRMPWENLGVQVVPGMDIGLELHVDDDDDGRDADHVLSWFSRSTNSWSDPGLFATVTLAPPTAEGATDVGPVENGASLRVWSIGQDMSELMRLVPGQTPNVSTVVASLDLEGAEDFGGLADQFIAEVRGFLTVDEAGRYGFRLSSDDGSRLWIDNRPVIDHDGLHAAQPKDGELDLGVGAHPFRIRMFENAGDEALKLEWQTPGSDAFVLVPTSALSTTKGEVRVTSPGRKRVIRAGAEAVPGDRYPLAGVHPAYDLMTMRPEGFEPKVGGMDFLPDGRLVISTWDPSGSVYILDGVQGDDPSAVTVKRFASGLAEPLGLEVVDGEIYVLQKQELTHLIDHDGDEVCDEYRSFANGWLVSANFHEFAFGLVHHDGFFYGTLAAAIIAGGSSPSPQLADRGHVVRIAMDGSYDLIASGLRTPNGIGFGADGEIYIADNQGDWLPSSKILHLKPGAFYGFRSVDPEGTEGQVVDPPVVWLPQGEIGNSPGEIVPMPDGPYAGQQLHTEITHGGLKRVFVETVGGVRQGAVFRFTQGLEAGINRAVWGPDGALYVGGIGSTGNWGQEGKSRFGLQRLAFNGAPVFEMLAVRAKSNGLEVQFTEPLPEGLGWDPIDYRITQWRYVSTIDYGGPKVDEAELPVLSATVSEDRTRVFLELADLKPDHVVHVHLTGPFTSEAGRELWSTEAWYTLNRMSIETGDVREAPQGAAAVGLTPEEQSAGFRMLFDGSNLDAWKGFNKGNVPNSWRNENGLLRFLPGGEGGDIATKDQFASFELRLDWRVSQGGNSGIMYHSTEDHTYPWETAPEMQILDNARHPDGQNPMTSAGANYALHAPTVDASRPAGQWNSIRLVVRDDHVEHWLNGQKVVDYTLWNDEWTVLVSKSKFASMPDYGMRKTGHIVLQDHGDVVEFRSIRIREFED